MLHFALIVTFCGVTLVPFFFFHFSNSQLLGVDIQGSGHMLYDPEIATSRMFDSDKEFLFCAGNLNVLAIDCFVKAHACNRFCHLG